jgi:gliding motility-associated transport system permease protein
MSASTIARLELKRLRVRPFAWTLAALTVAVLTWWFLLRLDTFLRAQPMLATNPTGSGYTDLVAVPHLLDFMQLCLLLAPLVTMQALAGERRSQRLALLVASGMSATQIVLGKFFSTLTYLLLLLLLAASVPLVLAHATTPDFGQFGAALLGCALCTAALAAIGVACSAFASHPALAAVAALLIGLALALVDVGARAAGVDTGWLAYLSLQTHLTPFLQGLVGSADIVYFLLLTVLALLFAIRRVDGEKVRG